MVFCNTTQQLPKSMGCQPLRSSFSPNSCTAPSIVATLVPSRETGPQKCALSPALSLSLIICLCVTQSDAEGVAVDVASAQQELWHCHQLLIFSTLAVSHS